MCLILKIKSETTSIKVCFLEKLLILSLRFCSSMAEALEAQDPGYEVGLGATFHDVIEWHVGLFWQFTTFYSRHSPGTSFGDVTKFRTKSSRVSRRSTPWY